MIRQRLDGGALLYEHIARLAAGPWNRDGQLALVVGATFPAEVARVRELAPSLPLLIPVKGPFAVPDHLFEPATWDALMN